MPEVSTAVTFCTTLVDEWVGAGLRHAVVCPGSRSTPMALALETDRRVRVQVFLDERSGGFAALGCGLATGAPAVVLTTSGTAAVNLHPAVVEAGHAAVPLLALTADRPAELHGVGAPQTIDQQELFGPHARRCFEPGLPDELPPDRWRGLAREVWGEATGVTGEAPGAVQLDLPFREPLLGETGWLPPGLASKPPRPAPPEVGADAIEEIAALVSGRSGILVAGCPMDRPEAVLALASHLGWPVLADPRSGTRVPGEAVVGHADLLVREQTFASRAAPEMVIRLGDLPASRVVAEWLGSLEAVQIGVDLWGRRFDPTRSLDRLLAGSPGDFCERLRSVTPPTSDRSWLASWAEAEERAAQAVGESLRTAEAMTEPALARAVVAGIPDDAVLVVSSSMPIRDVEWYSVPREGGRILANRGANGIDGVVSTAVGVATGTGAPTVALVGDLALLHDSNALIGLADRGLDLTIVVVDNGGGGIFHFLPQRDELEESTFERLFGTPHGIDLVELSSVLGLEAAEVERAEDVESTLGRGAGGTRVLVARSDRERNREVHRRIQEAVGRAVAL